MKEEITLVLAKDSSMIRILYNDHTITFNERGENNPDKLSFTKHLATAEWVSQQGSKICTAKITLPFSYHVHLKPTREVITYMQGLVLSKSKLR